MRTEFEDRGYVVVSSLIDPSLIEDLHRTTLRSFSALAGIDPSSPVPAIPGAKPFGDTAFDELMLRARSEQPRLFGAFYDSVQVSASLHRLVLSQRIVETAATLLGDAPDGLAATGQMFRMDVPDDKRNALEWHQEASYYEQNRDARHGIVVWIAMRDVGEREGSMMICPGSHKLGLISVGSSGKQSYESSEQLRTPPEIIERFDPITINARAGDAVFFHMHAIHRSGHNRSSSIRFSAGVRFHRMMTGDFIPGRFIYQPNPFIQERLGVRTSVE